MPADYALALETILIACVPKRFVASIKGYNDFIADEKIPYSS